MHRHDGLQPEAHHERARCSQTDEGTSSRLIERDRILDLKHHERRQPDQQTPSTVSQTEFRNDLVPARNADPEEQQPKPLRGASPLAPDKPHPQSSALRLCRPPLRSALSIPLRCITRVGRPLGLQLLPPTFARRRSACMYMPLPIQRQRQSATANHRSKPCCSMSSNV